MDNSNRLLVRLIDVALIVLLGFIGISRLKTDYVDLVAPGDPGPLLQKIHESTLRIHRDYFEIEENGSRLRLEENWQLEEAMVAINRQYLDRGQKLIFAIKSGKNGILQDLITVLDICQRYDIGKSLDYDQFN